MKYPDLKKIHDTVEYLLKKEMTKEEQDNFQPEITLDVFRQTWPNTATGFSDNGTMSGQAITTEYTTVAYEMCTDSYFVFFGNRCAYRVDDANAAFETDLKERSMKNIKEARTAY